eukprot:SAG31_NODE_357_length_17115_cov_64.211801_2_plen_703_part_00
MKEIDGANLKIAGAPEELKDYVRIYYSMAQMVHNPMTLATKQMATKGIGDIIIKKFKEYIGDIGLQKDAAEPDDNERASAEHKHKGKGKTSKGKGKAPPSPPPATLSPATSISEGKITAMSVLDFEPSMGVLAKENEDQKHDEDSSVLSTFLAAAKRPIWRNSFAVSMFLDAFIADRGQDPAFPDAAVPDGEYTTILGFQVSLILTVMKKARHEPKKWLPMYTDVDIKKLHSVVSCLQSAQHTMQWMDALMKPGNLGAGQAGEILQIVVSRLGLGQLTLLPLGFLGSKDKKQLGVQKAGIWGAFALVVERTGPDCCMIAVCVSGGAGLLYHPRASDDAASKVKAAPVVLEDVSLARLLDPAFTTILQRLYMVPSRHHTSRVLYEVLLPFLLNGKSVAHAATSVDQSLYSTSQRVAESRVQTCLCATKFLLRHAGLHVDLVNELMISVRLQCLDSTRRQLTTITAKRSNQYLTESDVRVLNIMTAQVCLAAAKRQQQGLLSPSSAHFENVMATVQSMRKLMTISICPFLQSRRMLTAHSGSGSKHSGASTSTLPIFPASFVDGNSMDGMMQQFHLAESVFDNSVARCAGRLPTGRTAGPDLYCMVLEDACKLCEEIVQRGGLEESLPPNGSRGVRILAALQLMSWVDHVFAVQLPLPLPVGQEGAKARCPWAQVAWTVDQQSMALSFLHRLAAQVSNYDRPTP